MGIAAAEAAIALSIIIAVYRNFSTIDVDDVAELKG
jgi:NADH:ubiquinone oxidoreductase subunit K